MKYRVDNGFRANPGFKIDAAAITTATSLTNRLLHDLPSSLYRSLDFKTSSAVVGAIFCEALCSKLGGAIVNPIEKGHPDIVPVAAQGASEAQLRNYGKGLEVKVTIGNIETGANLRAGQKRISKLTGITWQAHHQEVRELMGIVWDFVQTKDGGDSPGITGIFYSQKLEKSSWGAISGTTGRNTKVTGMAVAGKRLMGDGWILMLDEDPYLDAFKRFLGATI